MKWFFKLINFFLTTLDADLDTASTWTILVKDKIVDGYTLIDWEYNFYIIIDLPNKWARELFRIWKVDWKTLHYDKRISPSGIYNHSKWVLVQINDVSELLNYFSKNIDLFWFAEQTTWLNVKVLWWIVEYNWSTVTVPTTTISCTDDSTITLWLDFLDWTIKIVTDETTFIGYILCDVTSSWWEAWTIIERRSVNLTNVFDETYFEIVDWKYTFKENTIWTAHIQDDSITADKIQDDIIGTSKIIDNSITASKLKNKIIGIDQIVDTILVKINKTDMLFTWGSSTEFLGKDWIYHPLSVLWVTVDETWVSEWDYLVRRWNIWKPEKKKAATTFDNIFNHSDIIETIVDLKWGTCEKLIYEDTVTEQWSSDINVYETNFQYQWKFINISDVDWNDDWVNGVNDPSIYIYKQSRKLALWTDATWTMTLNKNLDLLMSWWIYTFFFYVSTASNVDISKVRVQTDTSNYFEYDFIWWLTDWWNYISVPEDNFTTVWTPSWWNINSNRFEFSTNISWSCDFNLDLLRIRNPIITDWEYSESWMLSEFEDPSDNNKYLSILWWQIANLWNDWNIILNEINQGRLYKDIKCSFIFNKYKLWETNISFRSWWVRVSFYNNEIIVYNNWSLCSTVSFTYSTWVDYTANIILEWSNISVDINWTSLTYTWLDIINEWTINISEWYAWITFIKELSIIKIISNFTKSLDWNIIRINEWIWFWDQIEFQKSLYKCVASWVNFLWWSTSSDEVWVTNDESRLFTIDTNSTLTYAIWWKDLTNYNYLIPISSNDLFKHIVHLDSNVTKIIFKYKTTDSDYFSAEFTNFTLWLNILTSQFDTLIVTGTPDYTNIQSIDIYIEVSASSEVKIEMLEIISVTPPASEIYTQTWDILYYENDDENNMVFMWDWKLVTNLWPDFIIDSWEFISKIKWDWQFILRDDWNQNWYTIKKTWNTIEFWKIVSWIFSTIWDSANIVIDNDLVWLKVICKNNVFKYYYSEDWLIYNLIDEVSDSEFNSWIISIIGKLWFRVYNILYVNEQSSNDISTMLMYQWWELVWSISRP